MMEQDKNIKQVLLNSAEGASKNFTDLVLKRISHLSVIRSNYQPLVPPKWQRLFFLTFFFIGITIIVLCLLAVLGPIDAVKWIRNWEIPGVGYNKILAFILCFWIVFGLNALLQKKLFHSPGIFHGDGD